MASDNYIVQFFAFMYEWKVITYPLLFAAAIVMQAAILCVRYKVGIPKARA